MLLIRLLLEWLVLLLLLLEVVVVLLLLLLLLLQSCIHRCRLLGLQGMVHGLTTHHVC